MNQELQTATPPKTDLVAAFKTQVSKNDHEFRAALPAHIPVERFTRVVMTAVVNDPSLLEADRRSLFEACMKAAQDGLLPDGREGAFVIFNVKVKGKNGDRDQWIKKVQWMPMIAGVLKKVRNSGELLSISAYVAYSNDDFSYELGDEEKICHRPALDERGKPRLVYAIAKTKDGGIYREIMTVADVEKVRAISRAKDENAWVNWWDEMARKSVLRRLSKRLPMSSDLDDLIRRDDSLYDFEGMRENGDQKPPRIRTLVGKLDAIAAGDNGDLPHNAETGEVMSAEGMGAIAQHMTAIASEAIAQPLAVADDPPANGLDVPSPNPRLDALLAEGRAAATNGLKKLNTWYGRLNAPDGDLFEQHIEALRKIAAAGDETHAGAGMGGA